MGFFTRTAMDALMKTSHPEINRRQWKLFCLPGLRRFGRFSAVHFDQIQH